jgi:hypothetical protein
LTRSRIKDQLHVIPDSDPGSHLSRDTLGLALPAVVLFILAKRSKTSVTNKVTGMYFMVSRSSNLPAQLLALGIRQDMWYQGEERYRYSACGENRHDIQVLPHPGLDPVTDQ